MNNVILYCFQAYEAYGLTETCGAMIMTLPFDYIAGHTGTPLPCSMVKLVDVPDMDINVARDGSGEVRYISNSLSSLIFSVP